MPAVPSRLVPARVHVTVQVEVAVPPLPAIRLTGRGPHGQGPEGVAAAAGEASSIRPAAEGSGAQARYAVQNEATMREDKVSEHQIEREL